VAAVVNAAVTLATWRKATASNGAGACLELATWRKSSRSGGETGTDGESCVELAVDPSCVQLGVRDSKQPAGGVLVFADRVRAQLVLFARTGGGEGDGGMEGDD
jgi:hypothetical protein